MSFLSPFSLAWLGLLAPLIALYVLKRRRERRRVGSTLLWESALRDMRAERPWKRLIAEVPLLLQIAAIVAGALALARPTFGETTPPGARVAIVIDASASMMAKRRDGRTRLEAARAEANAEIDGLGLGAEVLLIEAGDEAVVLSPPTRDPVAAKQALARLTARGGRGDLREAVELAAERVSDSTRGSRVVVYSDAAFDGEVDARGLDARVSFRNVGDLADNSGIVALDVRARPTEGAPDRAEVFVRVARHGASDADLFVTATIEGGGVVASRRVRVARGKEEGVVLLCDLPPDARGRAPLIRAEIAPAEGGVGDALSLDDRAVAASPAGTRLPTFIVGDAPAPVLRVLRADERLESFAMTLEAYQGEVAEGRSFDGWLIFSGASTAGPPNGDSLVVAPAVDRVFEASFAPPSAGPRIASWNDADPLLRFVPLADVHLGTVRALRGEGLRNLVETDAGPVISVAERQSGRTVFLGFDPADGDWQTKSSFVVFFRNLVEEVRARRAAGGIAAATLGTPLRIPLESGEVVRVTDPAGEAVEVKTQGRVGLASIGIAPGVYRVESDRSVRYALRNLLDTSESRLDGRGRVLVGEAGEGAPAGGVTPTTARPSESVVGESVADTARWLMLALLVFLVADLAWATRRRRA